MATTRVQLPDGNFGEFPAGMSQEQIQGVLAKQFPPPPDPRNGVQKAFDKLTTVTPEQEQGHGALVNKAQEFGAGAIGSLSPLVHPLQTIEGIGNAISHPEDTAESVWASAKEHPAQTLGGLVGGATMGMAGEAAGAPLLARIPTRAKAGALFDTAMSQAENEPVQLTHAMDPLERAQQLSARGHGTIGAADDLYKRINTVNPLNYREARDWGSGLSNITGEGKMNATPTLQSQVGRVSKAFNQDVSDAAHNAGVGDIHDQAMRDYARAMQIRKALINTAKIGGGAAATGYLAHRLIPAVLPER